MRRVFLSLSLLLSLSAFSADLEGFEKNYDDLLTARDAGDRIFVVFTAVWCGPCQRLKRDVLSTQRFRDHATDLGLRLFNIDGNEYPDAVSAWDGPGFPTWMLVKDSVVVYKDAGYSPSDKEKIFKKMTEVFGPLI